MTPNQSENTNKYVISAGHCRHLGATIEKDGVNFAVWCPDAKKIELLLFLNWQQHMLLIFHLYYI